MCEPQYPVPRTTICDPRPVIMNKKVPNDGPGPRGVPDCYYISRSLDSTFRYVRFVKKLRATEEEQRKGHENNMAKLKDQQISDFFIRCDRRSLINNVARRVDLCMRSYEEDLNKKRKKLIELFSLEEEADIRKFVVQAQQARETIWQEKLDRLQHLLDKRKKEHDDKYKDTPLTKCTHIHPCIVKIRQKEAQNIQRYQMKEKIARAAEERERDKMWYELGLKESDALAARMEMDAIERYRRDLECKEHSDYIMEQRRLQRERDREMLKREQLALVEKCEEDERKELQEEEARRAKRVELMNDRAESAAERAAMMAKQEAEDELIRVTWDSLQGQGIAEDQAKIALAKRRRQDQNQCNDILISMREARGGASADEALVHDEARRQQDIIDRKRCDYLLWSQKTNRDVRKAIVEQIQEKKNSREELKKKLDEQEKYHEDLRRQQDQLVNHHAMEQAMARKKHQADLLEQIEYNKLLKERARQEEIEELEKAHEANEHYKDEMAKMLCRPFFSEDVHPYMKQMYPPGKLRMKVKCPCSKPDYCK